METLEFTILGKPMPKQSVKVGKSYDGKRTFYKDSKIVKRENEIRETINKNLPPNFNIWTGNPIFIIITYVYKYPSSMSKKMINKSLLGETIFKITSPDVGDNLNKLILDVMEKTVYSLDSEIANINASKVYGSSDRTEITLLRNLSNSLFFPTKKH